MIEYSKKEARKLFVPLEKVDRKTMFIVLVFQWVLFLVLWQYFSKEIIPKPTAILTALSHTVQNADFLDNLLASLTLTFKAIFYGTIIALLISYSYALDIFKPIVTLIVKFRFLPLTGISLVFTYLTDGGSDLKLVLLLFGVVPFFVSSLVSYIDSINPQEYDLCKTLRMNRYQTVYHVIIKGKLDYVFEVVRLNFAICWLMITLVEGLSMSQGGIGALMIKSNRTVDLSVIFAYQTVLLSLGIFFDWFLDTARTYSFPHIKASKEKR